MERCLCAREIPGSIPATSPCIAQVGHDLRDARRRGANPAEAPRSERHQPHDDVKMKKANPALAIGSYAPFSL